MCAHVTVMQGWSHLVRTVAGRPCAAYVWFNSCTKHHCGQSHMASTHGHMWCRAGLPKLNDANNAGTKHSGDCTLILTEGDSAMSLAVAGLAVIGRDSYGVFPLRCALPLIMHGSSTKP